jgi:hypothetical protein
VSELRDEFPVCPHDNSGLDPTPDGSRLCCGTCKGVLMADAAVLALLGEVIEKPPATLPLADGAVPEPIRTCPRCLTQMTKHTLYTIQIDRCGAHGIWFDGEELQRVLEKVGMEPVKRARLRDNLIAGGTTVVYIAAAIAHLVLMR